VGEPEYEPRERESAREDIEVCFDADVAVGEFRQQDEQPDEVGERGDSSKT
jgi:hypothetical protein